MARIEYKNDVTRASEEAEGSDGRLNVSSRADDRAYYNARDQKQCYTAAFDFQTSASGEDAFYLKNDSSTLSLVVSSVGLNSVVSTKWKLWKVTGTAAAGNVLTPVNTNLSSSNAADCTAREGGSAATGITGLSDVALIDYAYSGAYGHEELRLGDRVRLGQNDAIMIQVFETAGEDVSGVVFFYFE